MIKPGSIDMDGPRHCVSVNAIYRHSAFAGPVASQERGTAVIRPDGTRIGAVFDPVRRPGVVLHAIEVRPGTQRAVALEDRDMAFTV